MSFALVIIHHCRRRLLISGSYARFLKKAQGVCATGLAAWAAARMKRQGWVFVATTHATATFAETRLCAQLIAILQAKLLGTNRPCAKPPGVKNLCGWHRHWPTQLLGPMECQGHDHRFGHQTGRSCEAVRCRRQRRDNNRTTWHSQADAGVVGGYRGRLATAGC